MPDAWVVRPWGRFQVLFQNNVVCVKIIEVNPRQSLSLQRHKSRDEYWIMLNDRAIITVGEQTIYSLPYQRIDIPKQTIHRVRALDGNIKAAFIEFSFTYFNEDDIERLEDLYGRIPK
jgi:mannose-1-phosphate guanylyltransferase/mannose-6-phosphate isomerase